MAQPIVLVVEDDLLIRMMAAVALAVAGLKVIEADTVDAALVILETRADEVAVIFSDIETPGARDGNDLARKVRDTWPNVPVVLTSGRRLPTVGDAAQVRFIGKPYSHWEVADLLLRLAAARQASNASATTTPARWPSR